MNNANKSPKMISAEYSRKAAVAASLADDAWVSGGMDALLAEVAFLRGMDADPVVLSEVERLCRRMMLRGN